ncbi:hypothetical protein PROFUN_05453 [Planoprotostelium fungivorum]|uniref:CRAL-TRIO domain-containing protein n=1 Tax=Planoprotostelium fungivorum TaxID=1890364 RepID=A0A2P6NQS1_9EUKA|nr:hypothetical protein PROFUN_05453 [Planoprotostelium fungivorum]
MVLEETTVPGFPLTLTPDQRTKLEDFQKRLIQWTHKKEMTAEDSDSNHSGSQAERLHLKFLRARNFNVCKSLELYTEFLSWKDAFQDIGVDNIDPESIQNEIHSHKCIQFGEDLDGRPVIWMRLARHKKKESQPEELERFCAWFFSTAKHIVHDPIETATVVIDLSGISSDNLDMAGARTLADMLGKRYPECLGYGLLLDAPWIFSTFWKLFRPFLDARTANKMHFVRRKELTNFIHTKSILTEYGGDAQYCEERDMILSKYLKPTKHPPK